MASSNRHWPSLFKSKPCGTHHQWQHDINSSSLLSSACQEPPYASAPSCEERSPEPKPRWNPKPEQIRILEAIFNSGMVNPPRDEIRKIRAQLQEFGQVGDANVFYWFQNRKSRNKHKLRHLQSSRQQQQQRSMAVSSATPTPITTTTTTTTIIAVAPTSSSSSSSDRSSASDKAPPPVSVAALTAAVNVSPSPTPSVNQAYFQGLAELCGEPFFFQGPQGSCYSAAAGDLAAIVTGPEEGLGVCPALWTELIMGQDACKAGEDEARVRMQLHYGSGVTAAAVAHSDVTANTTTTTVASLAAATGATTTTVGIASPVSEIQGGTGVGTTRSIVFINEMAFEVAAGPLNVREAFGDEAVLLNSSGHPVPTDELGLTLQPLQHGASYYLV